MGVQFDRLRYEVFQNLFLSPMNTGLLRPAVATAPTVYGIETGITKGSCRIPFWLQQHLPFTVLKPWASVCCSPVTITVATAPTVYGIETQKNVLYMTLGLLMLQQHLPFTVLKRPSDGIRWENKVYVSCNSTYRLRYWNSWSLWNYSQESRSCNSTYRLRYWNSMRFCISKLTKALSCNSTYRLRYWNE